MNNLANQTQPETNPAIFSVNTKSLLKAITFVEPGISGEETRYYLKGIFFDKKAGQPLVLVTTDGHRLHKIIVESSGLDIETEFHFIFDKAELPILKATFKGHKLHDRAHFQYLPGNKHVIINDRNFKTIDGTYPDYVRVILTSLVPAPLDAFNAKYLIDMLKSFASLDKKVTVQFMKNQVELDNSMSPSVVMAPNHQDALVVLMPVRV